MLDIRVSKNYLKRALGAVCARCFPARTKRIVAQFTLPTGSSSLVDRLIHAYLASRTESLESFHRSFWKNTTWYHSAVTDGTDRIYVPAYGELVQSLVPLLNERRIESVCEWGTGDGKWLEYLSRHWQEIRHFVGIDISDEQIALNRSMFPHLEFVAADLVEWTAGHARPRTLFHSNNGVLEYLTEESVRRLYTLVRERAHGSIVFEIEPVYDDFDPFTETSSRIVGNEHSFCHSHAHLLSSVGFAILRHEERNVGGVRMIIVLAAATEEPAGRYDPMTMR